MSTGDINELKDKLERDLADLKKRRRSKLILIIAGMIIGVLSMGLAWYWFGWQMALVLFLLEYSRNISK